MDDPRYPIGKFVPPTTYTSERRGEFIRHIAALPGELRAAVSDLTAEQLHQPYREGGWSVAQVVHHLADSHMNSYVRFKLAATAENPAVTGYNEAAWARFPDAETADLGTSLAILDAVHARWVAFLGALPPEAFQRTFNHSESGPVALDRAVALYAWHGRHHVAHITALRTRMHWPVRVRFKPDGASTVVPYLVVPDAGAVIGFLTRTFGAVERERTVLETGRTAHAVVSIGESQVMLCEPAGPRAPVPVMFYVYVPDTDAAYARALDAGAISVQPPTDMYYGDRNAGVRDAAGQEWWMATHLEDVDGEELRRRAAVHSRA
jgi:uncharacterized glyoxalase superfamily protein PhnB/uncharacterized damage-inducible protein DinB